MVPTWTLLAALAAGLILGALASRLVFKPSAPVALPPPEEGAGEEPALEEQQPVAETAEPAAPAEEPVSGAPVEEPASPQAEAAPAPDAPAEPVRISMEDVISELERRYQGRQADAAPERPKSAARRRPPRPRSTS